jgi:biofilm PGA synthesis protein PgaA
MYQRTVRWETMVRGAACSLLLVLAPGAFSAAPDAAQQRDAWLSAIKSQRDAGHRIDALALCEQLLARWPDDPDARRLKVYLLAEVGAPQRALALAQTLQPPLPGIELARLQGDAAAHRLRWNQAAAADPRQPYAEADRAVSELDGVLASVGTRFPTVTASASADRLIALDQARRGAEAVAGYRRLQREQVSVPAYADTAVADALLQQRQPEPAIVLYQKAIAQRPPPYADGVNDPRIGLMYANLEAGHEKTAIALIDQVAASEPAWLPRAASAQPAANPRKTDAALNAALMRQYTWQLQAAAQRLQPLLAQAPANATLWRQWSDLQRARGLPRAAEDAAVTAAGLDPNDLAVRLGLLDSWRDMDDYARVEPSLREVEAVQPRDGQTQQTRQSWDRQRGWQFDLEHDRGRGGSPDFGDDDHETQATLMSPLLADHWRVYGLTHLASANLPEGPTERDRLGVGVRTYWRGLEAYLQLLPAVGADTRSHSARTAVEAGVRWSPSDHWTFSGDLSSTGDQDVPLRAGFYGITARTLNLSSEWHANELTSARLGYAYDAFTDGNRRHSWQGQVIQRLYTRDYLSLDGNVQLGQSGNQRTDVPYYSPERARWAMLGARLENLLYQRYAREWRQRIDIAAGTYQEQGFGSGWIASVRYGQRFEPRAGLAFGWGLTWSSQPYDGQRDSRVMLDLTMHWGE